ncbi:MAG: sugar transferase [Eubacterium sp.]
MIQNYRKWSGRNRRKGLGYYLRHLSIDEFPNFWSILKGDMSLVEAGTTSNG